MTFKANWPAQRRLFLRLQLGKAGIGALLALGFLALAGRPGAAELLAIAGLLSPALLVLAAFTPLRTDVLEQASLVLFALLIGTLASLTGGVASPLAVWFVLVPAEAMLADGWPLVMRAGCAAGVVLAALAMAQGLAILPTPWLVLPPWQMDAVSVLAAVAQAVFIAAAAQTRQRAADAAAREGAAMYRFLADNAMDLITRHASDGRIRFASPAALALLGRAPAEIEGLAPAALVHPGDLLAVQKAFMQSSYFGRDATAELRLKRRDGEYVWAELRCRPAAGGDIVAVTRDIGAAKAASEALVEARDAAEAANRAKSRFLANMSHELRTPLNAIIGFSEVMAREMFGPLGPRYQDYSRDIHESGTHLLQLINSVLDMSKIEAGKFELYEELFELGDTVESAVRFVSLAAEREGVRLVTRLAPGAGLAFADKRAVKQILTNLLSNAIKYTPAGGEVRIEAAAQGAGIVLKVSDTGLGIAKADLARLGKPFEQAQGAHAKEGTGLGLALVKAFAVLHGGEVLFASVLGEGTSVTVRLPFAAVTADGARLAAESGAQILPFRGAA